MSDLRAHGVHKTWRGGPTVLEGASLDVPAGTSTLLTGRNGAGKTTLLRILAGLIGADAGEVRYGDLDPERSATDYRRRMAYLGVVSAGLYPRLKVRHHLDLWARLAYLSAAEQDARTAEMVEAFALRELLDRRPDRMSMGQRQRLRLAGTFLHGPELVLLDEPANSLDDVGLELLRTMVARTRASGGVLVWAQPFGEGAHGIDFDAHWVLEGGKLVPA
ncbi:ABC transporter ATP-binding protein [Solirubrobacter sp. CPCC 204708]|uniref:ABC transporter ATP-binding protein n=1 Tax=Solirubrobacter deserti TaxID=2282478 RepID=A0ABT4RML1_9ACTN|nr:ABC transporter ATP-binding protein [Solirubrobacter deserti]MBE2317984.1 ABC transporter ATP-binding protein [Solirubrobacter deserti]MDA0139663.1 ABC transporter ATP-binding protein [Solirubrobacter deserti]